MAELAENWRRVSNEQLRPRTLKSIPLLFTFAGILQLGHRDILVTLLAPEEDGVFPELSQSQIIAVDELVLLLIIFVPLQRVFVQYFPLQIWF